jgi:predicted nucleic acid-binding protein
LPRPTLIDIEVASAWRRLVSLGELGDRRAQLAMSDLLGLRLDRVPHGPLLWRCWELRENFTIYDAAYVVLAEILEVTLLTLDSRIKKAPGLRCPVEVLT